MTFDGSAATTGLAAAQAALDAYDYDGARALLEAALVESGGGLDAARALLELLVDVLGLDADALAVEPRLARPARRDLRVRSRLALAAARTGQVARALVWLEAETEPEVVSALLACAQQELSAGHVEPAQALLERARRIDPTEPRLAELERAVRDEKRFRALLLEEELDTLLAQSDPGAEAVARALLLRDGHNAKAAQVIERAEVERAEAHARQLLLRVRREQPTGAHSDRWVRELRAASTPRLGAELCQELAELAHALEARAAEEATRSAIEALARRLSSDESSTAELVESYLALPEASRRLAREQTQAPLLRWIDALALRRSPARDRSVSRCVAPCQRSGRARSRVPVRLCRIPRVRHPPRGAQLAIADGGATSVAYAEVGAAATAQNAVTVRALTSGVGAGELAAAQAALPAARPRWRSPSPPIRA